MHKIEPLKFLETSQMCSSVHQESMPSKKYNLIFLSQQPYFPPEHSYAIYCAIYSRRTLLLCYVTLATLP